MDFPRIYVDEACLDGYAGLTQRVLANSSDADMALWHGGNLGVPGCPACAAERDTDPHVFCPSCTAARAVFGAALVRFFDGQLLGEAARTPDAALAILDRDDLPAELVMLLLLLPMAVRARRLELLQKNVMSSSGTAI